MKYNSDKPITNMSEDLLGRAFFSKQLAKSIYAYDGRDGLVIGLFGKWGTGKTSIINMTEEVINNELAVNDVNKPIIMKFSPWNYSDKNDLIRIFFQNLKSEINIQGNEELKKKVGKALKDYSAVIEVLAYIPSVLTAMVPVGGGAKALSNVVKSVGENMMEDISLDKTRKVLENALIELNHKIIIVIDDIDRLTNNQIRDIFQLVKQVVDFPNVIYVLSMDREVVTEALKEIHNVDGGKYLEKIVQIPFEIPELNKYKVYSIFADELERIAIELDVRTEDKEYWNVVFRNCISPYIKTLRDVNRVISVFKFRYGANFRESSFEDMLAITTLEVLEPKLYKWIASNKDVVCKNENLDKQGKLSNRESYKKEFKELKIDADVSIECVSTLFPAFKNKVNKYGYNYQSENVRGSMRVADEQKFELYFCFDLSGIKVSRSLINACIKKLDEEELTKCIMEVNLDGNIMYFIEEVLGLVDKIPYERLSLLVSVILNSHILFLGRESGFLSVTDRTKHLVKEILKRMNTEEERYIVLSSAIKDTRKNGLGMLAYIINGIELAYARLAGQTSDSDGQIINLEQLEKLEKVYVEKIRNITESESILEIPNFRMAFYIWESFDKDGATKYINKLFENKVNKLKFACSVSGVAGNGWKFNADSYAEYIDKEELYEILDNIDKDVLSQFTELEKIKLASIYLNYNKGDFDTFASDKSIVELVNKWLLEK